MMYRSCARVLVSRLGLRTLSALWLVVGVTMGCDSSPASESPDPGSALRGPAIGDPCEASDGWQAAPLVPDDAPASSDTPVGTAPPPGYVDRTDLPPGVGFCLTPGGLYPNGYFTSNCHNDADCPDGARCGGTGGGVVAGLCVRPCTSSSECAPPSTCDRGGLVSFCQCRACADREVERMVGSGP